MSNFEEQVKCAAESAVLKFLGDGGWLMPNYEGRLKIPAEWLQRCWALVDSDALQKKLAERLESELVDRMVNHIAAELATDIKQILSVRERREAIRSVARHNMEAIMQAGAK